jgi:hypothetical protein
MRESCYKTGLFEIEAALSLFTTSFYVNKDQARKLKFPKIDYADGLELRIFKPFVKRRLNISLLPHKIFNNRVPAYLCDAFDFFESGDTRNRGMNLRLPRFRRI